jgi:pyruvate,water dikinase
MFKVILDTRGILRRMFTGAVERWTEQGRPRYVKYVEQWEASAWKSLPTSELVEAVRELTEAAVDAYGALVSGVIPAAWISEAWFTLTYKLVKRKDDPPAPTYLMGYDSVPIRAEKALYDLAQWTREQPDFCRCLIEMKTSHLVLAFMEVDLPTGCPEIWENWRRRFQAHLDTYGHMIYNLDFGNPVPADDPTPVIDTFLFFLRGEGVNPYERQAASEERRETAVQVKLTQLKGRRRESFKKNLERAQKYAPLREDGLADVGLSYPLVRRMLREIGNRFVEAGMIKHTEDIYWLVAEEVETAAVNLAQNRGVVDFSEVIPKRQAIWGAARKAVPPMMLPQIKILGFDLMALKSGGIRRSKVDTLKGVAASPGRVTASACVIHSPADFSKMRTEEILVAPLTTPAWTPLFARAAAVVTDVGGPLSHGSIVAREYGIPAVLGTGEATKRIRSGQVIEVDGGEGLVILQKELLETA